jgi:hypothetical protein
MPLGSARAHKVIRLEGIFQTVCGIAHATILGNGTTFFFWMSLDSLKETGMGWRWQANYRFLMQGSGIASRPQIPALHEMQGRVTKRESSDPLCVGSLALLVNDQANDPQRNHHSREHCEGRIHGYSFRSNRYETRCTP